MHFLRPTGRERWPPEKTQVPEEVIRLYDRFTHGGMDRRAFMEQLTQIAGSTAAPPAAG